MFVVKSSRIGFCVIKILLFAQQVKYDLTRSFTGEDDKETIHCEFDINDSGIQWTSGRNFLNLFSLTLSVTVDWSWFCNRKGGLSV